MPKTDKVKKKNILKALDVSAKALGNTRNVCRKYYIHPAVINKYVTGEIEEDFDLIKTACGSLNYISPSEEVILSLIENYIPKFLAD